MNDEFLHRLRKAPPPEFLDGLKARLERQAPLARTGKRRTPFARGLLIGLLAGSAAFAITSLSVNRSPASFVEFLRAPARLAATLSGRSPQSDEGQRHRVLPWGPVWGPKHPAPADEIQTDTISATAEAAASTNAASTNPRFQTAAGILPESVSTAGRMALPATQSGSPTFPYFGFVVAAPPATYPHAQAVAQHVPGGSRTLKVSLQTGADAVSRFCNTDDKSSRADLIELIDRIKPAQLRDCAVTVTELKVGHQAIVTARSSLYGSMNLSSRALFLALARQVPVASDRGQLIDNPYTTWNQIDNTLPSDRIHFIGPGVELAQGKLAAALLLAGCNSYSWIAELRETDPARYGEICLTVRGDGVYEERGGNSAADAERLVGDPTLLGIFSLSEFDSLQDRLAASVIDGVLPSPGSVAAGTYPNSRTLYLYTKQYTYGPNTLFSAIIDGYLAASPPYPRGPGDWGFVPLNESEHAEDVDTIRRRLQAKN